MRKEVKIIFAIIAALSIILLTSSVYAIDPNEIDTNKGSVSAMNELGGTIISVVQTAGTIIAIVIVVWVGIQYLLASTEQKAEYKKTMIAYFIGALLVFAGPRIVGIIYNMANDLNI